VYSSTGAAGQHEATPGTAEGVAAIAATIDQLAADVRSHSGSPEQTRRVAEIWLMVATLDPELARCIERYQTPASTDQGW
jgi:L-asparaginase II